MAPAVSRIPYPHGRLWAAAERGVRELLDSENIAFVINLTRVPTPGRGGEGGRDVAVAVVVAEVAVVV